MNTLKKEITVERLNDNIVYTYERIKSDVNGNARYEIRIINTVSLTVYAFNAKTYKGLIKDVVEFKLKEIESEENRYD